MTEMPIPPGPGITPEAAEALGLPTDDPRIVIDSDAVDSELLDEPFMGSMPFPTLNYSGGGVGEDVPPVSTGDQIPDVGIGEGAPEDVDTRATSSGRKRISSRGKASKSDDTSGARDAKSGPPSLDEWQKFFGKIVLRCVCDWYLSYAFRGIDEDALTDREIERLALTDEERKLISTPLAELANKSKIARKYGRTIVASGDTFNALVVLGAWFSRVNRIAAKYKPQVRKPNNTVRVTPEGVDVNGSSGSSTTPPNGSPFVGANGGRVPDGYPIFGAGSG